jgi:shikimate dehydrogenase
MEELVPSKFGGGSIQMIKAAVLGSPISHSLSPAIHRRAYQLLGLSGEYSAIEISEPDFPEFIKGKFESGWSGFSLTMPLKEAIEDYGFEIDPMARQIGSANTLFRGERDFVGTSTDFSAFVRLFGKLELANQQVLILGGGGTARAALGALSVLPGFTVDQVCVAIRSNRRQAQLRKAFGDQQLHCISMEELAQYQPADFVINTIPGDVTPSYAMPLNSSARLFEILYHPWPTQLANRWMQAGCEVIDGKVLLVEQAMDQIHLMTKQNFDFDRFRPELLAEIATS